MEAAFVEIGLEKNGFLYVDEIVVPELEGRKGARKIQDLIKRGETVLVQAVKDPMKSKGARLTTHIALPGRFLLAVDDGSGDVMSLRPDVALQDGSLVLDGWLAGPGAVTDVLDAAEAFLSLREREWQRMFELLAAQQETLAALEHDLAALRASDDWQQLTRETPPFVLGGGSNLVITGDVRPLVLKVEIAGRRLVEETP